jgi:hypothetical protein
MKGPRALPTEPMRRQGRLRGLQGVRAGHGWAALLLCGLLVQGSALGVALVARWTIERERQAWPLWAQAQAQALGQAGLMWTLSRLEDPRPVDLQCRARSVPAPTATSPDSFAARMVAPGRSLRCALDLNPGAAAGAWSCDCSATAATQPWPAATEAVQGRLDIEFDGSGTALRLRVKAQVRRSADQGPSWQESVAIQTDRQGTWRAVLGSWQDGR